VKPKKKPKTTIDPPPPVKQAAVVGGDLPDEGNLKLTEMRKQAYSGTLGLAGLVRLGAEDYGDRSILVAGEWKQDVLRIPSFTFSFDYILGGGIPIYGVTMLQGPEAGGKTTQALRVVAGAQQLCFKCWNPVWSCVCSGKPEEAGILWVDTEGDLDVSWAADNGVDTSRLIVATPEDGEEASKMAELGLRQHDCGLIVIDSVANMEPHRGLTEKATWDGMPGGSAKLIGHSLTQLRTVLQRRRKQQRPAAVLLVNQVREKLGIFFGNPETYPGGKKLRHALTLGVRIQQIAIQDKEGAQTKSADDTLTAVTRHSFRIIKDKILTFADAGEYRRAKADIAEIGLRKGQIDDFKVVLKYARRFGLHDKAPFQVGGKSYASVLALREAYACELPVQYELHQAVIRARRQELIDASLSAVQKSSCAGPA
jgi:RecA/RadA recombinase